MKIDFHSHSVITKTLGFDYQYFLEMVTGAKQNGLEAVVLTEHYNTLRFEEVYDTLEQCLGYYNSCFAMDGFRIFPGMEVTVSEQVHILLFGDLEGIRALRRGLIEYMDRGDFISFEALLEFSRKRELIIGAAHPLRPGREIDRIDRNLAKELDFLDFNAKDLYLHGPKMRDRVMDMAEQLGVPVTAGSDAHHFLQYGTVYNTINVPCHSPADIIRCIREGKYEIHQSDCLSVKIEAARIMKKTIKGHLEKTGKI